MMEAWVKSRVLRTLKNGLTFRFRKFFGTKRNTAAIYLEELERIGVLESTRVGRERLFLNPHLMRALYNQVSDSELKGSINKIF